MEGEARACFFEANGAGLGYGYQVEKQRMDVGICSRMIGVAAVFDRRQLEGDDDVRCAILFERIEDTEGDRRILRQGGESLGGAFGENGRRKSTGHQ